MLDTQKIFFDWPRFLTIQQKSKYPSVNVRESPCKSVAKKIGCGFRLLPLAADYGIITFNM